jgi:hypothetical protein
MNSPLYSSSPERRVVHPALHDAVGVEDDPHRADGIERVILDLLAGLGVGSGAG